MTPMQAPPPEHREADTLAALAVADPGPRPPGWRLTPRAVVAWICGGTVGEMQLSPRFVGERSLVERAVVTLAGPRGLLLVGEPGTAKSMLSELLAAAISGTSQLVVQGTAGTSEEQLRYGWNYGMLLGKGPSPEAMVPSPVLQAMQTGRLARVEEITRCLPEVQDALVSLLSDRRMAVPELGEAGTVHARPGFNLIGTANLRDRGVSEMSAALKRRFNFENVPTIARLEDEVALVGRQAAASLAESGQSLGVDTTVLELVVTAFRDLRNGRTEEGWAVERPGSVMSTAEAVAVATALGHHAAWLGGDPLTLVPGQLLGVVRKDDPKDLGRLLAWWDGPVKRRAEAGSPTWKQLFDLRASLERER